MTAMPTSPGTSVVLLRCWLLLALILWQGALSAAGVSWAPLPPGWQAWHQDPSGQAQPVAGTSTEIATGRQLILAGGDPSHGRAVIEVRLSTKPIDTLEAFAAEFEGQGLDRTYRFEDSEFNSYPSFHGIPARGYTASFQDWLVRLDVPGGRPWVAQMVTCAHGQGRPGREYCERYAAELEQVRASIRFTGAGPAPVPPKPASYRAYIEVPPDLKPGDVLSPSAVIVDEDGRPPAGEITLVWRIGGVQANSAIWDGKATTIRLDASAEGQALAAELALPAYGTAPPPAAPPPAAPIPVGPVPGLTGIGELPGPRDATEGLTGMLGPAALGLLGAMLSGLLNAPPGRTPPTPPVEPKPKSRKRARAAGDEDSPEDGEDETGGENAREQPKPGKESPGEKPGKEAPRRRPRAPKPGADSARTGPAGPDPSPPVRLGPDGRPLVPANPDRAARARRAAELAKGEVEKAERETRIGRIFTDSLGRAGKEIVEAGQTLADGARSAARTAGHFITGLRAVATDSKATGEALRAGIKGLADNLRTAGRLAQAGAVAAGEGLSAAAAAAKKAYHDPSLLAKAVSGLGAAAWAKLTAPGAIWGAIKNFSGLAHFEKAVDPKLSLLQRIGEVGSGVMTFYGAAQTAAKVAAAAQRSAQGLAARFGGGAAAAGQAPAQQGLRALAPRPPARLDPAAAARQARAKESLRALSERPKPRMNASYVPANQPPDLRGMPPANVRHAQVVADKYGAQIQIRPTNPDARRLLEGGAHPKPEFLKMKTIDRDDILIGAPRDGVGKVGYFKPQLPPKGSVDAATYQRLEARALQRAKEFDDQAPKVAKLLKDKKIVVRPDGTVLNGKTGRPFAGDHDLFDIRGVNGEELPEAVRAQIRRELSKPPFNLQHPEHAAWDYSHLRKTVETGEASSPYSIAQGVDQKILGSHRPGGEALITMNPDRPPGSSFLSPPAPDIRGIL